MAGGQNMSSIVMLVIFIGLFYLLLWLPQSKRAKAQRQLMSSLHVGDEIITSSGILGKIVKLDDDLMTLSIAQHVDICIQRGAVVATVPKGTLKW